MQILLLEWGPASFALVDDEDFDRILEHRWYSFKSHSSNTAYVQRKTAKDAPSIRLHRFILNLEPGELPIVDHKDRNGLNNQKSNLRPCSYSQNTANQPQRPSASGYRGVYESSPGRWTARIKHKNVVTRLGTYNTPEEAAVVWDTAAFVVWGEFVPLNFPVRP